MLTTNTTKQKHHITGLAQAERDAALAELESAESRRIRASGEPDVLASYEALVRAAHARYDLQVATTKAAKRDAKQRHAAAIHTHLLAMERCREKGFARMAERLGHVGHA